MCRQGKKVAMLPLRHRRSRLLAVLRSDQAIEEAVWSGHWQTGPGDYGNLLPGPPKASAFFTGFGFR